jgi:uncharacterized RDD family membrane protein YckC
MSTDPPRIPSAGGFEPIREYTPSVAPPRRYDTFWRRFGAGIIDGILLIPLGFANDWIFASVNNPLLLGVWFVFFAYSYQIYSILFHGWRGQTPGKMITRVRVLDISEGRLSSRQAVMRDGVPLLFTTLGLALGFRLALTGVDPSADETVTSGDLILSFTALGWFLAEVITMLFNNKRRAVHDFIARSVVVRV